MSKYYIEFNGIKSTDIGFKLRKLPIINIPKMKYEEYENNEIDGKVYKERHKYNTYIMEIDCIFYQNFNQQNRNNLANFMKYPLSNLVLGWEDEYIYKAKLINDIEISDITEETREFSLKFEVQPFKIIKNGQEEVFVTSGTPTKITNSGNLFSFPIIKVNSNSNFAFFVNGKKFEVTNGFSNIKGYIIIDSVLRDCYGLNGENLNKHLNFVSDFPILKEGDNYIEFISTDIVSFSIIPNWRSL